ncbi:uncharacterized protein ACA1_382310 [Acanthamoeba castellanii str. Neff]|uniref:Mitochondrial pyruvate carrier n=1 Tax=Acanthamoeba castellanii (strain ATCC 30010 / Neff) TaxID=1257118 RepID=L8GVX9_ACACF|nr:uncharacterized protein ACA1_382310 [Acanthamoeba castellanii str. Neff]ELR16763.1 hypothetical protein ACA1_382310 [Acanthamoeba castellanii str. Neff]
MASNQVMSPARRKWTQFVGTVGALANWGIPLAAISNIYNQQDPKKIDPRMTSALVFYSFLFMRWSLAITPANYHCWSAMPPTRLSSSSSSAAGPTRTPTRLPALPTWGGEKKDEVKAE